VGGGCDGAGGGLVYTFEIWTAREGRALKGRLFGLRIGWEVWGRREQVWQMNGLCADSSRRGINGGIASGC
jgi:hypothetical protein